MKVAILVMITLCLGAVSPVIVSTPENVAILRGTSTELVCRANSGSTASSWTFTAQGSIKDTSICGRVMGMAYNVNNVTSFRKIKDDDGFLNIRTDSVQPQDAGLYTCIIELQKGKGIQLEKRSAHLIVLDSDPNCVAIDYSANGRKYKQLRCSVGFRGNWSPVMEWRKGDRLKGTIVTTGIQNNTSSNFVSSNLTIPVDNGEETTVSYTCVTFFSTYTGNVIATATNIPNYIYIWPPDKSSESPGRLPVPANAVVMNGSNSTMVCKKSSTSTESTVYNWTFTAAGSTAAAVVIFRRETGIDKKFTGYQYSDEHDSCKLSTKSTQLENAGTYTCAKPAPTSSGSGIVEESAQLIVLESDPKCIKEERQEDSNDDRMETVFYLSCTVIFRGNWAPLMEWRFNDAHGEIIEQRLFTAPNRNVTSSLRLVASVTRQNAKYICRTFFGNMTSSSSSSSIVAGGSAKNIPNYSYTWTSPVINESNDVSLVTLIVSLAVVVIAILVALIVYHMVFKAFLAGRHRVPPAVAIQSFQTAQESEYAAMRETETSTGPRQEHQIEVRMPVTLQEDIYDSVAYGELMVREDPPPHYYRKLTSGSPSITGSCELHPYVNVPTVVDLTAPVVQPSVQMAAFSSQAIE